MIASILNKPHVWFIREFGRLDHDLKFYLPFQKVLRIIKESSNVVLTNSNAVRTSLFGKKSEGNILTVRQFIDIPPNAILENKKDYFGRKGATKLIIAGTISQSKGHEDAILAVKELIRRKNNVELIIVGYADPRYLKELRNLVEDEKLEEYVRFVDFQENVYPLISEADIVLVCSRNEAFGRVTLEAMLLKKPVIGTKSGGTKEIIKEEFNGFLYEPGDHEQLAEKIEFLIENRSKIREFGENAFKFVKKNFTKGKYGGQIYEVLKGLKNARNPASLAPTRFIIEHMLVALSSLNREMAEKSSRIEDLETLLKQRETEIGSLKETITQKDVHISHLEGMVSEKDAEIGNLKETLSQRAIMISHLEGAVRGKEADAERLKAGLEEKERKIGNLHEMINQKLTHISHLEGMVREKDHDLGNLQEAINQKAIQISHLERVGWEREATLNHIYNSHGWKALLFYYRMRERILPINTKRRLFAKVIFKMVTNPRGILRNLNKRNLKTFGYYFRTAEPVIIEQKIEKKISDVSVVGESSAVNGSPPIKMEFERNISEERIEVILTSLIMNAHWYRS